jgi:hypothetical protein
MLISKDLKWSPIKYLTRFHSFGDNIEGTKKLLEVRRNNIAITDMLWITQEPIYSINVDEVYNPRTVILVFLN